jgi:Domain of unknown function (DUF4426)
MTRLGWCGAVAGLALAACGQSSGDTDQGQADDDEVLSAVDSYKDFGDYTLHFNALTTDQLPAEAATNYGIVRSKNRVLLNIVILRDEEIGTGKPVTGKVTASARNLTGQLRELNVSEVTEGEAIYYLAQTQIVNAETLIFTVEATPASTTTPLKVMFRKQFFVDE